MTIEAYARKAGEMLCMEVEERTKDAIIALAAMEDFPNVDFGELMIHAVNANIDRRNGEYHFRIWLTLSGIDYAGNLDFVDALEHALGFEHLYVGCMGGSD